MKCVYAQDTIITPAIEQLIENIAEQNNSEDNDLTNLFDELTFFRVHPINLNKTTFTQLSTLPLLNELQVNHLLNHIKINGPLISLYELQAIEGFDIPLIYSILPYISIGTVTDTDVSYKKMLLDSKHKFIVRSARVLEKQKGYNTFNGSHYLGSPYKIYSRYRYSFLNRLSIGITSEKDAGEEFFKGTQKNGFDFYSAHFFYQPEKLIKTIAIGDYVLNLGQGLTLWQGFAFSKSSDVISIKKTDTGIRPYLSTDENRFMRGAAITSQLKKIELTGFISVNPIDANINGYDSLSNTPFASSLQETGLHSTASEVADKHAVKRLIYGGNAGYKTDRFKTGITYAHTELSGILESNWQPYNQFNFSGNTLNNLSTDYSYRFKNFIFFGEGAISYTNNINNNAGYAFLNGVIASLDPRVSVSLLQRNYSRNYFSFFSNGFSESSKTANEKGVYAGINIKLSQTVILNCYYDHYSFPWLKYRTNAPSNGNDLLLQIDYAPSKKASLYARYKNETSFKNAAGDNYLSKVNKKNYRLHSSYKASKNITLKSRIEFVLFNNENGIIEKGNIIMQDLIITKKKVTLYLRYALFDTPSYDSRIYTYENDISGVWSSPAYYYKGSRFYSMLKVRATKTLNCWLRYSQSLYVNKSVISPGTLNEINGNSRSEVKVQLDLLF